MELHRTLLLQGYNRSVSLDVRTRMKRPSFLIPVAAIGFSKALGQREAFLALKERVIRDVDEIAIRCFCFILTLSTGRYG